MGWQEDMVSFGASKQYKLAPVKWRQRPTAGKVTVGLASHWPCVTGFNSLSTYGFNGLREGDEHPVYTPLGSMTPFTLGGCTNAEGKSNPKHQQLQ